MTESYEPNFYEAKVEGPTSHEGSVFLRLTQPLIFRKGNKIITTSRLYMTIAQLKKFDSGLEQYNGQIPQGTLTYIPQSALARLAGVDESQILPSRTIDRTSEIEALAEQAGIEDRVEEKHMSENELEELRKELAK